MQVVSKKTRGRFWVGLLWGGAILIVCSIIAIWLTGYTYLYKTLIYTYPGIDDLTIFDSRSVNDDIPQPWPAAADYNKKTLPPEVTAELEKTESVAFLVIRDDSIAYEQYWDKYNSTSLSNSFSVAKSIVGILAGIAIGEGYFNVNDPVGKYIPEFEKGLNAKLRIKHLLTMSSGLNWDESYSSLFSLTTEAYYGSDLEGLVKNLKVVEEPGKIFRYMSCNSVLLALIIRNTTGKNISDYASEKLWKPVGATQSAFWSLDHQDGLEKAYCCFYSNARDFARIGKLYLDSGRWNGDQIVPLSYFIESTTPNKYEDEHGKKADYYGYQWWLMKNGLHSVFYARGILGQYIIVVPDKRIVIVRLGNKRGEKNANNHYSDMITYTEGVLKNF